MKNLYNNTIRTSSTRANVTVCAYSGEHLESGTQAILFRGPRLDRTGSLKGEYRTAWVADKYREEFGKHLMNQFPFDNHTPTENISKNEEGNITYRKRKGSMLACPVCQKQITKNTNQILIKDEAPNSSESGYVWMHTNCVPIIAGILEGNPKKYSVEATAHTI